ncbi:Rhotekin [Anas platyrhynchos]|uniref:Rhotekin n=1 Tax=Anas platyrhynchos TaxID=8839 RepID=R0KUW2_ANAPL|nr:Rhotekin [Anas platyrhynchos]
MSVTNRYGAEEVTHTLLAESRAETQRWMEAFWQHFYDMTLPGPAVPPSACEGLLLQDNAVSAEIRALLSSYYSDR